MRNSFAPPVGSYPARHYHLDSPTPGCSCSGWLAHRPLGLLVAAHFALRRRDIRRPVTVPWCRLPHACISTARLCMSFSPEALRQTAADADKGAGHKKVGAQIWFMPKELDQPTLSWWHSPGLRPRLPRLRESRAGMRMSTSQHFYTWTLHARLAAVRLHATAVQTIEGAALCLLCTPKSSYLLLRCTLQLVADCKL